MAAELITLPFRPVINTRGVLEPGALLDVFQAGTTTRISVFSDSDLSAALSNPVVANSSGVFPSVYWDNVQAVRVRVRESDGTVLGDADPYYSDGLSSTDLSFLQSGTGAQTRTVQAKLRDTVSVKDFGAVGDGVTNDRAAIALAVVAARGKQLVFPEGNYLINTDGGSITLEEVALIGENVLDGATASFDQGVNFHITGTTNSPFLIRRGVVIEGFGFYYPDQPNSATPTTFPVTLAFDFTNGAVQFVKIERNVFYNVFRLMDIDNGIAGGVGHVEILSNYICALNRGIYLRYNAEHMRVHGNNFTFGFWLQATEGGAAAYLRANSTALQIEASDGVEISDNLFFGYLNGIFTSGTGLTQFMNIALNKFDQVRYPVRAVGPGNFTGTIVGNSFLAYNAQNTALGGRSIWIETTGAAVEQVTITGNNFLLAADEHIFVAGNTPTRMIVISPQNFVSWARFKTSSTFGAISVSGAGTNVSVTGGWFNGQNAAARSIGITGAPNTINVTGATFLSCWNALSLTTNTLTGSGNVSFITGDGNSDPISATTRVWGPNQFDKPDGGQPLAITIAQIRDFADDAAAATGGVTVGGFYRTGSTIKVRAA
jgi:hypothetical protein